MEIQYFRQFLLLILNEQMSYYCSKYSLFLKLLSREFWELTSAHLKVSEIKKQCPNGTSLTCMD